MATMIQNASITPSVVQTADSVEFVIRFIVGPGDHPPAVRFVYDFMQRLGASPPSLWVNEDSGYVEVYVSNPHATWRKRIWDIPGQRFVDREHPASREGARMLVLDIEGRLAEGDAVELHWGETTQGFGPGAKVTSVVPRDPHLETVNIRYFADPARGIPDLAREFKGCRRPIPDGEARVQFRILPRPPVRLRLLRKTDKALLLPLDPFWNIAPVERLEALVEASSGATRNVGGVFEFQDRNVRVESRALPMTQTPAMDNVFEGMHLYWGDLHTHSRYSSDCLTRSRMDMTPGELMAHARDRSGLDFFAVTDHHNIGHDHIEGGKWAHVLREDFWQATLEDVRRHHEDGRFVVFPGFEYSTWPRGDTIVLMNWMADYAEIVPDNCPDIRALWKLWADRDYISIPHFHNPGALEIGDWWRNPRFEGEPVLEILSDHGSFERADVWESGRADCKRFRADRCGVWFLKQGDRYGFAGHSDDHKGHVGVNALTAIFSRSLDRDAVFDAYRKRRIYATSNARIRLVFTANGQLMGSELPNTGEKEFAIDVTGESILKKVELFRNGDFFQRFVPDGITFRTVRKVRDPGPSNWYVRVTQQNNHVAISSPVWFT